IYDVFVAKLNADATRLDYATYLGGSGEDDGNGIAVDSAGNAYVTGKTRNFTTTPGAGQAHAGGSNDAFAVEVKADGTRLSYATYLGGSGEDDGHGIAVDSAGNAYVTGDTGSDNFPTTPGAVQANAGVSNNAFVAKVNADGTRLIYATCLGGSAGAF